MQELETKSDNKDISYCFQLEAEVRLTDKSTRKDLKVRLVRFIQKYEDEWQNRDTSAVRN